MFETLGVKCEKNAKATGRPTIGELRDGTPVALPVRVVVGAHDGPTLCLTGVLHGDEVNGLAAINKICDELDPAQLHGIVIAFPCAGPFAFMTKSRISEVDYERLNMNRVFPGNPNGLISERVAAAVFDGGIRKANYHIDFHEGGYDFIARYLIAHVVDDNVAISEQNRDLAIAFGLGIPVNLMGTTPAQRTLGRGGTSTLQANEIGIPSMCNELGGGGHIQAEYVGLAATGTVNVMKEIGMLEGEKTTVATPQLIGSESIWPRPEHGGWWDQVVELGQVVEKGAPVGHVRNTFGEVVEELYAPHRSVIYDIRNSSAIMTGEWTVHCGKLIEN